MPFSTSGRKCFTNNAHSKVAMCRPSEVRIGEDTDLAITQAAQIIIGIRIHTNRYRDVVYFPRRQHLRGIHFPRVQGSYRAVA